MALMGAFYGASKKFERFPAWSDLLEALATFTIPPDAMSLSAAWLGFDGLRERLSHPKLRGVQLCWVIMRITMRMSRGGRSGAVRVFEPKPAAAFQGGARPAMGRSAQKIVLLSDFAEKPQKLSALLGSQGGHGSFLSVGDLGLCRRHQIETLQSNFYQFGPPVVFGRPGRHQASLLEVLHDDRDRRSIERHGAADRRLVHRAMGGERGQSYILQRREVERLTLVEEDRHRDLMATAQQMPRRLKERFGCPEARRIIALDQRCLTVPVVRALMRIKLRNWQISLALPSARRPRSVGGGRSACRQRGRKWVASMTGQFTVLLNCHCVTIAGAANRRRRWWHIGQLRPDCGLTVSKSGV
jgi:hypothetical protein